MKNSKILESNSGSLLIFGDANEPNIKLDAFGLYCRWLEDIDQHLCGMLMTEKMVIYNM
jgi:hypothetical protein